MSLSRRKWFLHRVLPAGAIMAAGSAGASGAAIAEAAAPDAGFVDKKTGKSVSLDKKQRVHPQLQYGAQVDPDKIVRVIVQKTSKSATSKDIAARVGKSVIRELPLINGFLVEISQKLAAKLAEHPHVRYISIDSKIRHHAIPVANLKTAYPQELGLPSIWNGIPGVTGLGVTVAVLDSGVNNAHPALTTGVVPISTNSDNSGDWKDLNGHGTHVAGIIRGYDPAVGYVGIAPNSRVVSIKVANRFGVATESDVIDGMQWVYNNRGTYNIRAVNLSISGAAPHTYLTSPLAAAAEQLWFGGVVVVAASGNRGTDPSNQVWYTPGNDPFVITVGAIDDNATPIVSDDSIAPYSSKGTTQDGFYKPDVVAPGRKIAAPLAGKNVVLAKQHPTQIVDTTYIRLSGTSMATPVVVGVIALILEKYPNLSPDQVKWLLTQTMQAYPGQPDTAGLVNPAAALQLAAGGSLGTANQGVTRNSAVDPTATTVSWSSAYWESAYWESAYWESAYWEASAWEAMPDDPNMVPYDPTADPDFLANNSILTW